MDVNTERLPLLSAAALLFVTRFFNYACSKRTPIWGLILQARLVGGMFSLLGKDRQVFGRQPERYDTRGDQRDGNHDLHP